MTIKLWIWIASGLIWGIAFGAVVSKSGPQPILAATALGLVIPLGYLPFWIKRLRDSSWLAVVQPVWGGLVTLGGFNLFKLGSGLGTRCDWLIHRAILLAVLALFVCSWYWYRQSKRRCGKDPSVVALEC